MELVRRMTRLVSELCVLWGHPLWGWSCLCFIRVASMGLFSLSVEFPHSSQPLVYSSNRDSIGNWCLFLPLTDNLHFVVFAVPKNPEWLVVCDDICLLIDFAVLERMHREIWIRVATIVLQTWKLLQGKLYSPHFWMRETKTHKGQGTWPRLQFY